MRLIIMQFSSASYKFLREYGVFLMAYKRNFIKSEKTLNFTDVFNSVSEQLIVSADSIVVFLASQHADQ
jgi:hypothetical protein